MGNSEPQDIVLIPFRDEWPDTLARVRREGYLAAAAYMRRELASVDAGMKEYHRYIGNFDWDTDETMVGYNDLLAILDRLEGEGNE